MTIRLFAPDDAQTLRRTIALRIAVFVEEQGVPLEEEVDRHDEAGADAVHAAAIDANGELLGTGRFYRNATGDAQIGRMAVARTARGRGVGAALLDALIAEARRRGFAAAQLDAQTYAINFYTRAGFALTGAPEFLDGGIPHRTMRRRLDD